LLAWVCHGVGHRQECSIGDGLSLVPLKKLITNLGQDVPQQIPALPGAGRAGSGVIGRQAYPPYSVVWARLYQQSPVSVQQLLKKAWVL